MSGYPQQGGPSQKQGRYSPRPSPYDLRNSANRSSSPSPRVAVFGVSKSDGSGRTTLDSSRSTGSPKSKQPPSPKLSIGRLSNGGLLSSPGHNSSAFHNKMPHGSRSSGKGGAEDGMKRDLSRDCETRERTRRKFTDAVEEDVHGERTSEEVRALFRQYLGSNAARDLLVEIRPSDDPLSSSEDMLFGVQRTEQLPIALIKALSALPIGRTVLEQTGVGRSLGLGFPAATNLVQKWSERVRQGVRLGFELEAAIFEKHVDPQTNTVTKKDNHLWKYHQDCRSAIANLRKHFNDGTRKKLMAGKLSVPDYLSELELHPETFSSPAVRALTREKAKENLKQHSENEEFPFTDPKMECVVCGQKDKGCRYDMLYYDAWGGFRARENTRTVLYKCCACGAKWRRDE